MSASGASYEIVSAQQLTDVDAALRPILETCVGNTLPDGTFVTIPDEIDEILESVEDVRTGRDQETTYRIAQTPAGTALAMMGLRPPEEKMMPFAITERPGELITAYAHTAARGLGIGSALLGALTEVAKSPKHPLTELIVNSGRRYIDTGWEFWHKAMGEPVAMVTNFYGPGGVAMVWRKVLDPNSTHVGLWVPNNQLAGLKSTAESYGWPVEPINTPELS